MKKESVFQKQIIDELRVRFPDCIIIKNDSSYIQGFPDLTIFFWDKWATLECKNSEFARHQPNQDYYVQRMNNMSFSAFIYPENMEFILGELEHFMYS